MKKSVLIVVILYFTIPAWAQHPKKSTEIGFFGGCSYYIGDLNPVAQFDKFTQPAFGFVYRRNFNTRLAARITALKGSIGGNDATSGVPYQQQRNLNFRSDIYELSGQLEFNFLDYDPLLDKHPFSPYIFVGLAGFKFDPQGNLNGRWVDLQPLGTEGQGLPNGPSDRKYKLTQISIPFGMGIKIRVSQYIGITLEWGMRKTFTDYLDDVSTKYYNPAVISAKRGATAAALSDPSIGTDPTYSNVGRQRGDPSTKDWYNFSGIVLTIKFKEKRPKCPGVYK